jgi:hypothetical protein
MRPLAKSVVLAVAGLLLAALVATAALTNGQPPLVSRPLPPVSTNSSFAPIVYLDGRPEHSQPLKPGIYQTRPYAIILVVPGAEHDDCCVVGGTSGNSKMPVIKPDVRAIPKTSFH